MQWIVSVTLDNTIMARHFHTKTIPASVPRFVQFTSTAAECALAFGTTTFQKNSLIQEFLALREPNEKWVILKI
jgi:hypothetical protein